MSTVKEIAETVAGPLGEVTKSITEFLVMNDAIGYGQPAFFAVLGTLLIFHYIAWVLENNAAIKRTTPQLNNSIFELRVYLQVGIIAQFVYWSCFFLGLVVARTSSNIEGAVASIAPLVTLLTFLVLVNKLCQQLTGITGTGPSASWPLAKDAYGVGLTTAGSGVAGGTTPDDVVGAPWATSTAHKWLFVPVYWIQNVTEIVTSQFPSAFMFGFAAGATFPRA